MPTRAAPQPPSPLDQDVRDLRQSSRLLVRVLGLMHHRVDGVDCTPAQCHALIEIAGRGRVKTGELAELLEVDKSTASRTLQALLRAGLVAAEEDPDDLRAKPVRLTNAGRKRVKAIHAGADEQVRDALALLTDEERQTVLRGVALYEGALHRAKALAGVTIRPIKPADNRAMSAVIREVLAEFGAIGGGYASEDDEIDRMHAAYAGKRSAYFVAVRDGQVTAGGGIAPLAGYDGKDVCELRKMHALPSERGLGIGRLLLDRCLAAARAKGYRTCYLETLRHMHRARALYEKLGFERLDGPMGDTGHYSCNDWYALEL